MDGSHQGGHQFTQLDVRHDEGVPQGLESPLGALVRELKELNPRANMRELRDLGGYDHRRLPAMPRVGNIPGCYGALLGLCTYTNRTCRFIKTPEADLSAEFLRDFAREVKPVLERTVQGLKSGHRSEELTRYRGSRSGGWRQAGRR